MNRHYLKGCEQVRIVRSRRGETNPAEIMQYRMVVHDAIKSGYLSTEHGTMQCPAEICSPSQITNCADTTIYRNRLGLPYVLVLDDTELAMVLMGDAVVKDGIFRTLEETDV